MSSKTRQQLEKWIKSKTLHGDILDIGGIQNPITGRAKGDDLSTITFLDLPDPHKIHKGMEEENYLKWDMNKCMSSDHSDFDRRDLFGTFDTIVCLEVTEYLWNPICALKNMSLLLNTGGKLFISFHFIYPIHNPADKDLLRYTKAGAVKLLEESGFEITESVSRTSESPYIKGFYIHEGMKMANGADQQEVGVLIEAKKK